MDDGAPFRVFFEDDVLPHTQIRKVGEAFWNETQKDVDILYMGNMVNPNEARMSDPKTLVVHGLPS